MHLTTSRIVLAIQLLAFIVAGSPVAMAKSVEISSVSPSGGRESDIISITGSGFALSPNQNKVVFTGKGGRFATVSALTASADRLTVIVPSGAASGRVYVQVGAIKSNALRFDVNSILNKAPSVNAGADQTLTLSTATVGTKVTGTVSDDGLPTASPLAVKWSLLSGPAPVSLASEASTSTAVTFSTAGMYTLRLTASDTELVSVDSVVITVSQPAPTVSQPAPTVSQPAPTISQPAPTVSQPAPTVSLSANPATVTTGQSVTLTWSSTNATSCTASGAWSGTKALSGSASESPTSSTTYMLSCLGPSGSTAQSATVAVNPSASQYNFSFEIKGPTHVVQGHSLYLELVLKQLSGTPTYVDYSVAGLPEGARASFPDLEVTCCGPTKAYAPGPTGLRITTTDAAPQGSFPVTVSAASGGVTKTATYLINIDPVPVPPAVNASGATALLTTPSLLAWDSNMIRYGQKHCAALKDPSLSMDQKLGATYYDAERVYYQIATYTGSSIWNDCAQAAEKVYRDSYVIPNNGAVPGYWNFTRGLRRDYELTGDDTSVSATLMLSKAGYARANTPFTSLVSASFSREVSYAIMAYIDAEKTGQPRNPQLDSYVDVLLGHFDQWFVSQNHRCPGDCDPIAAANQYYILPFMVGLGAEALIQYHEEINPDPRIPGMVKIAADWLWAHAWHAPSKAFWYENYISDPALIGSGYWAAPSGGAPDLNLLIAPMYAWLFHKTGDTTYRDQGDQAFAGGVAGAYLDGAKQFDQSYRWSFDFVKWRSGN